MRCFLYYLSPHQNGLELSNQLISYTVWSNDGTINITSHATTGANGFFKLNLEIKKNWTIQMQTMINDTLFRGNTFSREYYRTI